MEAIETNHHTIVIGGGQAGLTVGYELQQKGIDFLILDSAQQIGDSWRNRWDSLLLFTPARFNGLPGMPFPAPARAYITKDEVADFLQEYASFHDLPVRSNTRVTSVTSSENGFAVETETHTYRSQNVVVAMADYQKPGVPGFAPDLSPDIIQMHSSQYRNTAQLQDGPTLVVGIGNSGADIGLEVARNGETYISGNVGAVIPWHLESWFGRYVGVSLVRWALVRVLNTGTPIGRRLRPKMLEGHPPLVRVKPKDLTDAGATMVPRVKGVRNGLPELEDDRTLDVANVIWCTGFRPGFDWIKMPIFGGDGRPSHERGVVPAQPGLYFCGLYFLHAVWSETLSGMPTDALHIVDHLVARDHQLQPVG